MSRHDEAMEAARWLNSLLGPIPGKDFSAVETRALIVARALLSPPASGGRDGLAPCDVEELSAIVARVEDTEAFPIGGRDFDVLLGFINHAITALTKQDAAVAAAPVPSTAGSPDAESIDCAHRPLQNDYKIVAIYKDPQDAASVMALLKHPAFPSPPPLSNPWREMALEEAAKVIDARVVELLGQESDHRLHGRWSNAATVGGYIYELRQNAKAVRALKPLPLPPAGREE